MSQGVARHGPGGPRWAPVGPVAPVAGDFGAIFLG